MTSIDIDALKALILKSEPDFLAQAELSINGFGSVRKYSPQEDVWVWHKEAVRKADEATVGYLVLKIIE